MAKDAESFHRALYRDTTFYLCYALLISALGPFQFGYHLVRYKDAFPAQTAYSTYRLSLMHLKP